MEEYFSKISTGNTIFDAIAIVGIIILMASWILLPITIHEINDNNKKIIKLLEKIEKGDNKVK